MIDLKVFLFIIVAACIIIMTIALGHLAWGW